MADNAFPGKLEEYVKKYRYSLDEKLFLDKVIKDISSDDQNKVLEATAQIRKMIEYGPDPPCMRIIQSGVVSHLIKFLGRDEFPPLQMEAIYILGLLVQRAEYMFVNDLLDSACCAKLQDLISQPDGLISIMAIDTFGHIAKRSVPDPMLRNVVSNKVLQHLKENLDYPDFVHVILGQAIHNIFTCEPLNDQESNGVCSVIEQLLQSNEMAIISACRTLNHFSRGKIGVSEGTIISQVCPRLIDLLNHNSESIILPTLSTLGNVVGDDGLLLNEGVILRDGVIMKLTKPETLNRFGELLVGNFNNYIKGAVCCIIQIITMDTGGCIEQVINQEIIDKLVRLYKSCEVASLREEVAKVFANVATHASGAELRRKTRKIPNATPTPTGNVESMFVAGACIEPLCGLLDRKNDDLLVLNSLKGLQRILLLGRVDCNLFREFKELIEKSQGVEKILVLHRQERGEAAVKDRAFQMLSCYWSSIMH